MQSNSSYHMMVAIPLSFGCKCASFAGIWTSSTGMTIGSRTPTTSPASAPTCALTHFSRITSNALIFFDAATPSLRLSLWSLKTCRTFAALASLTSFLGNLTAPPRPPRLCPSRTLTTKPTPHPILPSLPPAKQDHSILLTGLWLSATWFDLPLLPGDACTTQNSPTLRNQLLTLIGLFMGSTVGISYLRFGLSVFPSTSHYVQTLLSMDALSSLNSTPPHRSHVAEWLM